MIVLAALVVLALVVILVRNAAHRGRKRGEG